MEYHKVLERQIKKLLPETYLNNPELSPFLLSISNAYNTYEKDKKISDHVFAISEKEYQEVTNNLNEQNQIKNKSILQLKSAIKSLAPDAISAFDSDSSNEGDLIKIIDFLQRQIILTKELEVELRNAKDAAEQAASAKSDFLSVMSHEIRTPLNAIIGYIHLLQQEDTLPSQNEFLRILQISADNLLSLINDVLDFGKIEEGKIAFSERDIDIRQLVNNIKQANRIRAEERGNKLRVMFDEDIPMFIKCDEVRLSQVLNNLISNAIKFTRNGSITIEVLSKKETGTHIELYFAVADTGIGIPEEKQQLIFERFTQANSNITREFGGFGLGLAIIKKLLQLQESDIGVESVPGKGSKFFFSLQFHKSKVTVKEEKSIDTTRPDLKGIHILLVEDVEFNVMFAKKLLSNWNALVDVAENGLVAVEKIRTNDYAIVLMDIQMPVMDGLTASMKIREFNNKVPIVALTASTSSELQEKAFHCVNI
jgi:signal transduction histidine kinase/CheY-like chemotaxis protein